MRYFDRTFFKFTLGFLCIVCVSLLVIYFTSNFVDGGKTQIAKPISAP